MAYVFVTLGVSFIVPAILVGATVVLSVVIPGFVIDSTLLTIYFVITCTLYNAFLLAVIAVGSTKKGEDVGHYFSLLIPAYNEEKVIGETVERVLKLNYPSELFEVVVINDGSTDETEAVVKRLQSKHRRVKLINIPTRKGGRGKSAALNSGFADFLLTWRGVEITPRHRWLIGVFDSDASPDPNMLKKVSFQFNDPKVGGVQTLVRIKNYKTSFLARLQDIEFLAFGRIVQYSRTKYAGSVALGGNGQFVRSTALDTTALEHQMQYWNNKSLTEDLDLGVRLLLKNWKNVYMDDTFVSQEGTETPLSMFRQRERWAWGTLQTLSRFVLRPSFWRAKIRLTTKIDVSIYLIHITLPILVFLCWAWSALSFLGIIHVSNLFPLIVTLANGLSFIPFYGYGLWKERKEYPAWQIMPLVFVAVAYTYHWIPCVTSALIKNLISKPKWVKTPRFSR